AQTLTRLFDRHRIIFWYDAKKELRSEFEALDLPGVEKIVLDNNQFGVKYRILRAEPEQHFLLYHHGPPPPDIDNWLLDVQLAYGEFRADQTALWLSELGLGLEFSDVVAPHTGFFNAPSRIEALKGLLKPDDTPRNILQKMLAVSVKAEPRLDSTLESLLAELASGKNDKFRLVQRCALDDFLWEQLARAYDYTSDEPGIQDFAIELFKSSYALGLDEPARLTPNAIVFFKRWKDSVKHQDAFGTLSAECADILGIKQDLQQRDYRTLIDLDYFKLIDVKILSELVQDIAKHTISAGACAQLVRQRRQSHWYQTYKHLYVAVDVAARFLETLEKIDLRVDSLSAGIEQYSRSWYQLDQLYRQFIFHAGQSGQPTLLAPLMKEVENRYENQFLLPVNDNWQKVVDASSRWSAPLGQRQQDFFEARVRSFLRSGNKVSVIISDALRYEIGDALLSRIRQEDRYEATLYPALSVLPSYTQLGMAALLPHESLTIAEKRTVLVDGASSQGMENRKKILEKALPGRATAIKADDLLKLGKEESRSLIRYHDVVYVYHNRIDAIGDKRDSEGRVFEAVEDTLDDLIKIVKKLANANASNMLVTADHGFIYQNRVLAESDFASDEPSGSAIVVRNRRFVLGKGLTETASFKHFSSADADLSGEMEMLIPKSINRLRLQGAGSRYVHGGAALQEVVIPVIQINKKRRSDVTTVAVDILPGSTTTISTGQLTATLYQAEAVTDKVQPRTLRAGIYTQTGELISDRHDLTFDLASDNPREREIRVQFLLTKKADTANDQDVFLRLEEPVPGTAHYREYKKARYLLRRSFTSDFDF
ncbi:MAG: BREX-1 system phosphatase PglZ type A, partial [Chloroflexi bacterium]|nr:BREX-1 system phosphatase PglZ type A [Chloroflexota bacterium]